MRRRGWEVLCAASVQAQLRPQRAQGRLRRIALATWRLARAERRKCGTLARSWLGSPMANDARPGRGDETPIAQLHPADTVRAETL